MFISHFLKIFVSTITDLLPIAGLVVFFHLAVFKKPIPNLRKVLTGTLFVLLGLSFFLLGLEKALFPMGESMARQLSHPDFLRIPKGQSPNWLSYKWIYLFSAAIGFSTTIAEPSLIAVSRKAHEASGGTISQLGLRITVACGVAFALVIGSYRIISGTPLYIYILAGYIIVILLTLRAPKDLIALAYDSGGVTTSTVTVPIVTALGIGISSSIEGSNPAIDGFGQIAIACLFPIIAVLAYGVVNQIFTTRKRYKSS